MESKEVLRNVILASVLEPIPEKIGCTTRSVDLKPTTRLEHFIIAGVNIGWDFYELAERIRKNNYKQPQIIFDIALNAQRNSFKNRTGKKINFGIIELLVPIISAQLIYKKMSIETLDLAVEVLKQTSKKDVEWHYAFRKYAKDMSNSDNPAKFIETPTVYEYFCQVPKVSDNDAIFHNEIISGFPLLKQTYEIIERNVKSGNLLDATVVAYDAILPECNGIPGVAADYICVALYLYLSNNPDKVLI
jgi:hypothetical protein